MFLILGIFKSAKSRNQVLIDHEESDDEDNGDDLDAHMLQHCFEDTT
jgi:hypothetical protein